MSHLRLALFDVDGTLIDSASQIISATRKAFAAFDLPIPSDQDIRSGVGLSVETAMDRLSGGVVAAHALSVAYREAFFGIAEAETRSAAYEGADALLRILAAEDWILLGVATGKSRRGLDRSLKRCGWDKMFHTIQVADAHPSKPHPSMVLTALAESGVMAKDCVMIGDTTYDMLMGKSAGVRTMGVGWGYHTQEALREVGADCTVARFDDIPAALEQLWGA